nr:TIGR04086 family membrane protein [Clostridia bacterium]
MFSVIKGTAFAVAASLLAAIIFAVVLRTASISDKVIYPVNQTLKVLSVALGSLVFVRGEKGWLKGGGIGLLFTAVSYLAFAAIGGDFSLSWLILAELLLGLVAGAVSGIIAVNVKR